MIINNRNKMDRFNRRVCLEYFENCAFKNNIIFSDLQLAWICVKGEISQMDGWVLESFEQTADTMDQCSKYIVAYNQRGNSCYILSYMNYND
jgi:hypothetical protein